MLASYFTSFVSKSNRLKLVRLYYLGDCRYSQHSKMHVISMYFIEYAMFILYCGELIAVDLHGLVARVSRAFLM